MFTIVTSRTKDYEYTTQMVLSARNALIERGLYLGASDVSSQVSWQRNGKIHQYLATTEDVEKLSVHSETPDTCQPLPYAILSAIVFILSEDYWLTSCRMWKPDHKYPFANVRPTCTSQAPMHPMLSDDFRNMLSNMDIIIKCMKCDPSFKGALVTSPSTRVRKLKFRHILFEVCMYYSCRPHPVQIAMTYGHFCLLYSHGTRPSEFRPRFL